MQEPLLEGNGFELTPRLLRLGEAMIPIGDIVWVEVGEAAQPFSQGSVTRLTLFGGVGALVSVAPVIPGMKPLGGFGLAMSVFLLGIAYVFWNANRRPRDALLRVDTRQGEKRIFRSPDRQEVERLRSAIEAARAAWSKQETQ